jgi:starch synthase
MRVLFAISELYPYVKTGGLGDVAAALPLALAERGLDVRFMLPGYPEILGALKRPRRVRTLHDYFSRSDASLLCGTMPCGLRAYVLDAPHFYERASPYGNGGHDWPDNHLRFAALSRAAADVYFYDDKWQPDVVHGNDWHTGLMPAYLAWRGQPRPASVMTIHNLAFQGLFPRSVFSELGLPPECFSVDGLEFWGQVGFMKAALYYADRISTVSPTYAREIQTPKFGCGLDGLLRSRARDLKGILNGVDVKVWNPATDHLIPRDFDTKNLEGKADCKRAALEEFGFRYTDEPLFTAVSRLTPQKGLDLLVDALPPLLNRGLRLIILGEGDAAVEKKLQAFAAAHPESVAVRIGYDERTAHMLQAGADAVIVPSRFEPCGLVQMYGLRYGTLPVVRRTGGLADSVVDAGPHARAEKGTGFVFAEPTAAALSDALSRALDAYRDAAAWTRLQRNAMAQDVGWDLAAEKYAALYEEAGDAFRAHSPFSVGTTLVMPPLNPHGGRNDDAKRHSFGKAI